MIQATPSPRVVSDAFHPDRPTRTRCPACGYLRHGLSTAALCPECGWDPAEPDEVARPHDDAAGWSRAVAAGIVLLVTTSLTLLGVTLVMRFREGWGGSLPVVNFPGPKVWAAALVQRTVGNQPGYWGVTGTVAALQGMAAVWLVTVPQADPARIEALFSPRRLARWGTVLMFGAGFGLLTAEANVAWWGDDAREQYFLLLIAAVELPGTALLYLHLRTLAGRDETARRGLTAVAVGAPALIGLATLMLLAGDAWGPRRNDLPQQLIVAAYGAAAVGLGLVALTCLARLFVAHAAAGFGGGTSAASDFLRRLQDAARPTLRLALRHGPSLVIAAGCLAWLVLAAKAVTYTAWLMPRAAVLDDLPFFNFVGPKAYGAYLGARDDGVGWQSYGRGVVPLAFGTTLLVTIWAMTVGDNGWLRRLARWWPTLAAGALLAVGVAHGRLHNDSNVGLSQQSKFLLLATVLIELPATLLLYLHLATIARRHGSAEVGRGLVWAGIFATTLILAAVWTAGLTDLPGRAWLDWKDTAAWTLAAAAYGAATVAASVYAAWQVLRLVGVLLAPLAAGLTADDSP